MTRAPIFGFKDKGVALALRDVARQRMNRINSTFNSQVVESFNNTITKAYVVRADGAIPAIDLGGANPVVSSGDCTVLEINPSSGVLTPSSNKIKAWNLTDENKSAGDDFVVVQERLHGEIVIPPGGGGGGPTIIEFTTDAPFTSGDASVGVTVTKVWSGGEASANVMVYNTCGIFSDLNGGACGVAVSNQADGGQYQIIQLECDLPAQQEGNFQSSLGDSITYAGTATPIPFGRQTNASQGDLVTLEADGSFTFNRATRGGILDITFSAVIDDILGIGNDGEKSIFQIEYDNLGGGGYAPIEVAVAVGHPSFRIPPSDYGLGGTTFGHWTFSTSATTGHKLRMVASTANGNTVSTEFLQSLFKVTET